MNHPIRVDKGAEKFFGSYDCNEISEPLLYRKKVKVTKIWDQKIFLRIPGAKNLRVGQICTTPPKIGLRHAYLDPAP